MDDQESLQLQPHGSVHRIETAPQSEGDAAVTTYHVTLRDRETQRIGQSGHL
jgi:hypothetical protein